MEGSPIGARRRATASLCLRSEGVLTALIRASRGTVLGPRVTPQTLGPDAPAADDLAAGRAELADGPRFFSHFRGYLSPDELAGLRVLDLGCGYGGRSIFYATACGATEVIGVEPFPALVSRSEELARLTQSTSVSFLIGAAENIPSDDGSFDAVIAFDVLEHVRSPAAALLEIRRVLRPGGHAWLVFPTYRGARASHLDFITRLPALHRIFDPDAIVSAVNRELARDAGRFGVRALAQPEFSDLGHLTLPSLNGLDRREALNLIRRARLRLVREIVTPAIRSGDPIPGAHYISRFLDAWHSTFSLPELLMGSLAYHLVR